MSVEAPSGIVNWYNAPVGDKTWSVLRAKLTGKKQPDGSQYFSHVNLSEKEVDELIENMKNDPKGFPIFDESSGKSEEYQKWLVARYHTKPKEDSFENTQKESPPTPEPTSSAIVPQGKKPDDLVEEEIDPQILSILGLEDVFDLTYEEYASLLKEAAVKGRMPNSQMSTESIELVTDEFKRVKGKTGLFKVKVKKVDIDKVLNRKVPSPQKVQLDPKKLLPPSDSISDSQSDSNTKIVKFLKDDLGEELSKINEKLVELLSVLKQESSLEKKEKEKKRRKSEKDKKTKRESELESSGKSANKIFEKVAKPFVSFFDRIKQFFLSILIGSALNFLLSVFKNPSIILNPLKNLANGIVGFLNNIISFLWNFFISPINFVIGSINNGVNGLINQINKAISIIPGAKPITPPQIPTISGPPQIPTPFPIQQQEGGGQVVNYIQKQEGGGKVVNYIRRQEGGGYVTNIIQKQEGGGSVINVGDISFEGGGQIKKNSGVKISGFGKDDRLIAAQEGEVMMSNPAGDFWGRDTLLAMNAMGGGTNQPKFGKLGVQPMQGGGQVGTLFPHMDASTGGSHIIGQGQLANLLAPILSQASRRNRINPSPGTGTSPVNRKLKSLRVANSSGSQSALAEFSTLKQAVDQYGTPSGFANSNYMSEFIRGLKDSLKGSPLIIGMDHSRRLIPNSPTDLRTTQASATGASYGGYTERDFTDAIARRIQKEISNARIIKPEDYKNYEEYDKALKSAISKAKLGQTRPPAPVLPPPSARPSIVPLPLPITPRGTNQTAAARATSAPNQAEVPYFSSEDPNNMTTLVVRSIYNVVG